MALRRGALSDTDSLKPLGGRASVTRLLRVFVTVPALGAVLVFGAPSAAAFPTPDSGPVTGGTTVTVPVPGADSFLQVSAGYLHSLAVDADGNVWAWGSDASGQIGNGATTGNVATPTQVTTGTTFTAVAAGISHSLALDADGNLWAWGNDSYAQLGNGAATGDVTTPTQITTGTTFTAIATGYYHSLALDAGGNLWTWGHNVVGQLGNGTAHGTVTTPTQIATGTTFTAIAGGGVYSLALDADGDLWTWGNDGHGQLGNGAATGDVTTPTQITSGTSFTNLKGGRVHSLALDADGNLWTWGSDDSGELGNGAATGDVTTPTQITTGTSFTALEGGDWYSLALDADGNLWTWGRDDTGQLGNGAAAGVVTTPTRIGGTTTVTGIAFDGVPGTNLQRLSETRALVTTPAGAAGPATITIQYTYDGAAKPALTLTPAFTYIAAAPTTGTDSDTGSSGSGGTNSGRAAFVGQASVGQASVGQAPAITLHPSDATANAGDSFTLTVQADGDPTPDIRWQVSTDSGLTWTDVAGETGSSLTLTASEEVDGNHYRAVATNDQGTATSDAAILTVEPTTVATASPSPTPSATPSPSPTETTEPTGDDSSSGIPAWVWIGGGTTLLLLLLALAAAAAQRRQT